jgi:hypothetical protein
MDTCQCEKEKEGVTTIFEKEPRLTSLANKRAPFLKKNDGF